MAINDYLDQHNADPKPFAWTASASSIIDKVNRGKTSVGIATLGWSSLMNKKLEINSSVESTAGASVNARHLGEGQQDFATGMLAGISLQAYSGNRLRQGEKSTRTCA